MPALTHKVLLVFSFQYWTLNGQAPGHGLILLFQGCTIEWTALLPLFGFLGSGWIEFCSDTQFAVIGSSVDA